MTWKAWQACAGLELPLAVILVTSMAGLDSAYADARWLLPSDDGYMDVLFEPSIIWTFCILVMYLPHLTYLLPRLDVGICSWHNTSILGLAGAYRGVWSHIIILVFWACGLCTHFGINAPLSALPPLLLFHSACNGPNR